MLWWAQAQPLSLTDHWPTVAWILLVAAMFAIKGLDR